MTHETKHTPGPWRITDGGNVCNCVGHTLHDEGHVCIAFAQPVPEGEANARLIAAAPELLAALEWCEQVYGNDWPENASIRETIREAKGL